jgi:hypothetical protein
MEKRIRTTERVKIRRKLLAPGIHPYILVVLFLLFIVRHAIAKCQVLVRMHPRKKYPKKPFGFSKK